MKLDASIPPVYLQAIPEIAQAAEKIGFDTLWTTETQHDPFIPGALIAEHTQRLCFGTAVAIAFGRSPATLAYTAWDLAQYSSGRFILGLGTQVRPHIEKRFGMPWPASPVGKLREEIAAIRAFWTSWQTGEPLRYKGEYYHLSLMTPFFNPGPMDHPAIPIFIAGVNTGLARLAGETADGFHVHPFHSPDYINHILLPAIRQGASKSGRESNLIQISISVFASITPEEREFSRQQLSFYASTPTYRSVLEHHGWGDIADQLSILAKQKRWGEMPELFNDELLAVYSIQARDVTGLANTLRERYQGIADRITLYLPFIPGRQDSFWRDFIHAFNASK